MVEMINVIDLTNEEWREIPKWEIYEASSMGRIRHKATGRIKIPYSHCTGYLKVQLTVSGQCYRQKALYVASLIATTFLGERPTAGGEKYQVNHLSGDKRDNRASNLQWVTQAANIQHSYRMCLNPGYSGTRQKHPRFWEAIKLLWKTGNFSQVELANIFGTTNASVSRMVSGKMVVRGVTRPVPRQDQVLLLLANGPRRSPDLAGELGLGLVRGLQLLQILEYRGLVQVDRTNKHLGVWGALTAAGVLEAKKLLAAKEAA